MQRFTWYFYATATVTNNKYGYQNIVETETLFAICFIVLHSTQILYISVQHLPIGILANYTSTIAIICQHTKAYVYHLRILLAFANANTTKCKTQTDASHLNTKPSQKEELCHRRDSHSYCFASKVKRIICEFLIGCPLSRIDICSFVNLKAENWDRSATSWKQKVLRDEFRF